MSNAVYPTLPGLGFEVSKVASFNNLEQVSVTGKETRVALQVYPMWRMSLQYEFLRSNATYLELQNLLGFFLQRRGSLESFLLDDPDDSSVTDQNIGTGNGSTTDYQLLRTFGGFTEPLWWPNVITNVKVSGAPASYSHLGNGVVRITPAPANGAAITWTGTYRFRCRFLQSQLETRKFMYQLWNAKKVEMIGSLQDKIL